LSGVDPHKLSARIEVVDQDGRDLVVPDVGHDDCAVGVGLQLTAMRLSDPEPLREVEDLCQPVQRSPDVGEDQHRNDGGGGMERFRFILPR
jgi:hypothetical protein